MAKRTTSSRRRGPKGVGTTRRRPDGIWEVQVSLGVYPPGHPKAGKRRRESVYGATQG